MTRMPASPNAKVAVQLGPHTFHGIHHGFTSLGLINKGVFF
jgi:hypothetical protein